MGAEATKLFDIAQLMLDHLAEKQLLKAKAVISIFPANSNGAEDSIIYSYENRGWVLFTIHNPRQQNNKASGIRPATGYPSCPDHTEKDTLWKVLDIESNIGIKLTESFEMYPSASGGDWYFSYPELF